MNLFRHQRLQKLNTYKDKSRNPQENAQDVEDSDQRALDRLITYQKRSNQTIPY